MDLDAIAFRIVPNQKVSVHHGKLKGDKVEFTIGLDSQSFILMDGDFSFFCKQAREKAEIFLNCAVPDWILDLVWKIFNLGIESKHYTVPVPRHIALANSEAA